METKLTETVCSVCGTKSEHTVIIKSKSDGVPDIDLRPSDPHRSSMEYWVMECPECRYCNGSLETPVEFDRSYLESREYTELGGLETQNELVSRFVRKALVNIKNRNYTEAVQSYLYASWVFDDEGNDEKAKECRNEALSIMENSKVFDGNESMYLLRADLLRRTGQFEKVISDYGERFFESPLMLLISQYSVKLAKNGDSSVHKMSEVPGVAFE
ncbi:MAG: DUF2225 domain-containing protein [Ruminococcus sp.]|nr:DUF2225 domain-containing protein [Ruminococcus sp.]MDE6849056.1 DUF2225 domain-containing protein [Ruminococcus sp.]MDE7138673.1 DUF2225 domain-containing protein [Ruminococcus sp.]